MYQNKRIIAALAAVVLTIAACDRGPTQSTSTAPKSPEFATNVSTVCKGTSIPTGYVILSYTTHYTCQYSPSGYPNAMSIGLPASPESVCDTSPIPTGWVITSMARRSNCDAYSTTSSSYKNTNSIKQATATYEYVCDASPIPSNYTYTSYTYYTSSCDRYGNGSSSWHNASRIQKI